MRSGGRAGATSEGVGRGGAGGTGGTGGGSAAHGKDDKEAKRKFMVFEDDDAWLDDDESGPDVIR